MDLLWYGFPWHFQQIYRECRRQSHIAYSSHSLKAPWTDRRVSLLLGPPARCPFTVSFLAAEVSLSCLLEGTWYILFSILSSAMVIAAWPIGGAHETAQEDELVEREPIGSGGLSEFIHVLKNIFVNFPCWF